MALTGRRHAYYSDYQGTASEWLACARYGYLFQGQWSPWSSKRFGHSTRGLPMAAFVAFLENHDQVANSLTSTRLWQQSSPGCLRAMTALLLLGPWTPLLFQGQEWNSSSPFAYFADHKPDLAALVKTGRADFMAQFPGAAIGAGRDLLPDPSSAEVFAACSLNWDERTAPQHRRVLLLFRDLLALRRDDPTLRGANCADGVSLEFASLTPTCGVLRFFANEPARDRLLIVNLGPDFKLAPPFKPVYSHDGVDIYECPAVGD